MKKLAGIKLPKYVGWKGFIGLLTGVLLLPVFLVMARSVFSSDAGDWSHIGTTLFPVYALNSFILLSGCTAIALVMGTITAWLVSVFHFPFRKQIEWMLMLPLAIPAYISAISYVGLTDYAGPIQTLLRHFGMDFYMDIMNKGGAAFIMGTTLYPYVYVAARGAFLLQSGALIEVSRTLGKTLNTTFLKTALPVAWPAIFSGVLLVAMEVLNDYGVVHYFGIPTFTAGIFKAWLSQGNLSLAAILSMATLLFVMILYAGNQLFQRNKKIYNEKSKYRLSPVSAGKKWLPFLLCMVPLSFGFFIPISQLLWWAILAFDVSALRHSLHLALHTFLLGTLAACIITVLSVVTAYTFRITPFRRMSALSSLPMVGYAIPGAIIAIGVVSVIIQINPNWMYVGIGGLIYGYTVRFFAVGIGTIDSGFKQIPIQLDMAGASLGRNALARLVSIQLPILKPVLAGAFIMVFIDVAKELPLTLLLRPFNFETLSTHAFQYAKDEMAPKSALPSLLIIFVSAVPVYYLNKLLKRNVA